MNILRYKQIVKKLNGKSSCWCGGGLLLKIIYASFKWFKVPPILLPFFFCIHILVKQELQKILYMPFEVKCNVFIFLVHFSQFSFSITKFCNRLHINHWPRVLFTPFLLECFRRDMHSFCMYVWMWHRINEWRGKKVELEPKCKYLCENIMQNALSSHSWTFTLSHSSWCWGLFFILI